MARKSKDEVVFKDRGKEVTASWSQIFEAAARIQAFFRAVQKRFVERDEIIKILKYAFLLREHVLIYGPPGTAKTAIADTVVRNIRSAKSWRCDLSRFMSEPQVFGDFDIKRAQDTGELVHRTDGSILEADFANLGELLDCNTALLRSLLRVLNEREFLRGPQQLNVPLLTAVANTNVPPHDAMKKDPMLEAVLDRFLFWEPVDYVKEPAGRLEMLRMFLARKHSDPLPELSLDDVLLVSGVVLKVNLITDEFVLQAYEELARKFAEKRGRIITDRRLNKGVQIIQASAVLDGETTVDWDDLAHAELVLVDLPSDRSHFKAAYDEVMPKWRDAALQAQAANETVALEGIEARIPQTVAAGANPDDLVATKRLLLKLRRDAESVAVTTTSATAKRAAVLATVDAKVAEVQAAIDTV